LTKLEEETCDEELACKEELEGCTTLEDEEIS
jgi:hypothetical protein